MTGLLVTTQSDENWVLSADGSRIFVAGNNGLLKIYDAATGERLQTVRLGLDLEGITLSPDGSTLVVTERVPHDVFIDPSGDRFGDHVDADIYVIDAQALTFDKYTKTNAFPNNTFGDVAFIGTQTIVLSQTMMPNTVGSTELVKFDLGTGQFSGGSNPNYNPLYSSIIDHAVSLAYVPGFDRVLVGETRPSTSADYFLVNVGLQIEATNDIWNETRQVNATGIEATSGLYTAIVARSSIHLYQGDFDYVADITHLSGGLEGVAGLVFSPSGMELHILDASKDRIVTIDVPTLRVISTVATGNFDATTLQYGDELVVDADGGGVFFNAADGIHYQVLPVIQKGTGFRDNISGDDGVDYIYGRGGDDAISGLDGDDRLFGGAGKDTILGGKGDDVITGNGGDDALFGGGGDDVLNGGNDDDSLSGNAGFDTLRGGSGSDILYGGASADRLYGNGGNDVLVGEQGRDILFGGGGADIFVFADGHLSGATTETADRIMDFRAAQGDKIDLTGVDAIKGGADDAFTWIGQAEFGHHPGEIRWQVVGPNVMVFMDVNGDAIADFAIRFANVESLSAADFLL